MALETIQNPLSHILGVNYKSNNTWWYDDLLDHHHHDDDQYLLIDKSSRSSDDQNYPNFDYFLGNGQTETCPTDHYFHFNGHDLSTNVPHFEDPSSEGAITTGGEFQPLDGVTISPRPKRRSRSRARKNKEEIENQRMTHIAVERNRRKQMNEYLAVLRSLMPESYVQRGDQASIIGGAINFVKELEQQLQFLGVRKGNNNNNNNSDDNIINNNNNNNNDNDDNHNNTNDDKKEDGVEKMPFSEFFSYPQYSTSGGGGAHGGECHVADVEVTVVESHANVKIRCKRRPKLLVTVVSGLHTLRLTVLHLNVTTLDQFVLYSLSLKVEDDSKMTSVEEIASGIYHIIVRIDDQKEELVLS